PWPRSPGRPSARPRAVHAGSLHAPLTDFQQGRQGVGGEVRHGRTLRRRLLTVGVGVRLLLRGLLLLSVFATPTLTTGVGGVAVVFLFVLFVVRVERGEHVIDPLDRRRQLVTHVTQRRLVLRRQHPPGLGLQRVQGAASSLHGALPQRLDRLHLRLGVGAHRHDRHLVQVDVVQLVHLLAVLVCPVGVPHRV